MVGEGSPGRRCREVRLALRSGSGGGLGVGGEGRAGLQEQEARGRPAARWAVRVTKPPAPSCPSSAPPKTRESPSLPRTCSLVTGHLGFTCHTLASWTQRLMDLPGCAWTGKPPPCFSGPWSVSGPQNFLEMPHSPSFRGMLPRPLGTPYAPHAGPAVGGAQRSASTWGKQRLGKRRSGAPCPGFLAGIPSSSTLTRPLTHCLLSPEGLVPALLACSHPHPQLESRVHKAGLSGAQGQQRVRRRNPGDRGRGAWGDLCCSPAGPRALNFSKLLSLPLGHHPETEAERRPSTHSDPTPSLPPWAFGGHTTVNPCGQWPHSGTSRCPSPARRTDGAEGTVAEEAPAGGGPRACHSPPVAPVPCWEPPGRLRAGCALVCRCVCAKHVLHPCVWLYMSSYVPTSPFVTTQGKGTLIPAPRGSLGGVGPGGLGVGLSGETAARGRVGGRAATPRDNASRPSGQPTRVTWRLGLAHGLSPRLTPPRPGSGPTGPVREWGAARCFP